MLGAGGDSSWAPVETPSEVWAEARGAVVGSVLGAAALIALLVWYFLRRVRAVRGNYAIDLQDEGEVEPLSAMEALVTPLAMSRRSTSIGKKDMSVPRLLFEGYTAAQLSGVGHLDAGEAGPSTHTWEPENDAAYADAVLKKRPPPTYAQVLYVTRPGDQTASAEGEVFSNTGAQCGEKATSLGATA